MNQNKLNTGNDLDLRFQYPMLQPIAYKTKNKNQHSYLQLINSGNNLGNLGNQ